MEKVQYINNDFLAPKDAWDTLSLPEKAAMMKVAVKNGIYDLSAIRQKYNEFAEGGDINPYTVGATVDALYGSNQREEFLGEPSHHYDFTQSEEWANAHGYYPDARGHRDDRVKKPAHPSHPSRGTWNGDKFELTDLGMQNPNYTLFGLTDGGQDSQAVLTYQGGIVLPEVTVTPNESYFYNPYDNIILHQKANGGKIYIKPSKRGTFTAAASKHGKSVQAFASQVLAHKENYSPAMVKKANFARNASKWKHGDGGNLFKEGGDENVVENIEDATKQAAHKASTWLMGYIRNVGYGGIANPFRVNPRYKDVPAQNTFLLPRKLQEEIFLKEGYIKGKEGDYGLVRKAVGDNDYPVYQRKPDTISRDKLIVLGNTYDQLLSSDSGVAHGGSVPSAIYTDGVGNFYQKQWDLNDYGGDGGSTAGLLGTILDKIGSPTVVTSGFQPIEKDDRNIDRETHEPMWVHTLRPMMAKKGLVPTEIDDKIQWTLPEVVITGKKHSIGGPLVEAAMNEYKHGGKIYIKPSHRGRLTELKKRTGKTEAELYRTGGPAVRKMITFARNARKWKHRLGGNLFYPGGSVIDE